MPPTKDSFVSKFVLSFGLIIVSIVYAVWQNTKGAQSPVVQTSGAATTDAISAPAPVAGKYLNGAYVGNAVDAYYGTVQVKAVVENGNLADVQFLQYPDERDTSRYINDQAIQLLTQEAIIAQSAQVDGVSGATFTSQAFEESLASALALAKN